MQVFLIQQRRAGWIQVLLPERPNGSTGWVHAHTEITTLAKILPLGTPVVITGCAELRGSACVACVRLVRRA
jgi:hypothetical protein